MPQDGDDIELSPPFREGGLSFFASNVMPYSYGVFRVVKPVMIMACFIVAWYQKSWISNEQTDRGFLRATLPPNHIDLFILPMMYLIIYEWCPMVSSAQGTRFGRYHANLAYIPEFQTLLYFRSERVFQKLQIT